MAVQEKSNVAVVLGCMTIGNGVEHSRITDLDECKKVLDIFQQHGHKELDTARMYGGGTSEEYVGKLGWQERGLDVATKFYPSVNLDLGTDKWTHRPDHLRENLMRSLKAMNAKKLHIWYLHGPDRSTPYEETLREINNLHKEGYFDRFGISNYMSWEVAQMQEICRRNGWIAPSVYQGLYNALHRSVEPELFPCLRHYGMSFYAFSPLGGGFFAGHIKKDVAVEKNGRFDPDKWQGKFIRARYWKDAYFEAMEIIRPVAEKHGLTLAEVALRWLPHHSKLSREHGDAILIGASSAKQLEANLVDLEKAPLPNEVLEALDQAWLCVKGVAANFFH